MTENNELQQTVSTFVVDLMPLESVAQAISQVEELKKKYMRPDQDYGEYAGIDKPVILKPGMEKLALMFNLSPHYEIVEMIINPHEEWCYEVLVRTYKSKYPNTICSICDQPVAKGTMICKANSGYAHQKCYMQNAEINESGEAVQKKHTTGYYYYVVRCTLTNKQTGQVWCSALGESSSRDRGKEQAPSNTILKMAEKRAFGAAVQNATCSSHLFTVDIDDDPTFEKKSSEPTSTGEPKPSTTQTKQKPKENKYVNMPPGEAYQALSAVLRTVSDEKGLGEIYRQEGDLREQASKHTDDDGNEIGADGINDLFAKRKAELREGEAHE